MMLVPTIAWILVQLTENSFICTEVYNRFSEDSAPELQPSQSVLGHSRFSEITGVRNSNVVMGRERSVGGNRASTTRDSGFGIHFGVGGKLSQGTRRSLSNVHNQIDSIDQVQSPLAHLPRSAVESGGEDGGDVVGVRLSVLSENSETSRSESLNQKFSSNHGEAI